MQQDDVNYFKISFNKFLRHLAKKISIFSIHRLFGELLMARFALIKSSKLVLIVFFLLILYLLNNFLKNKNPKVLSK